MLTLASLLIGAGASAGNGKVQICHFPPGNMDGFHTISVGEEAADAHLVNHSFDFLGECCEGFDDCDDGDPCTADVCDPSTGECVSETRPCTTSADCDEGNLCTIDTCDFAGVCGEPSSGFCRHRLEVCILHSPCEISFCDPLQGCVSEPKCQDTDPCTVDSCDPFDETCWFDPLCEDFNLCTEDICDASGQTPVCQNAPIPECILECPCWTAADIANTFGLTSSCEDVGVFVGIQDADGNTAFSVALNGWLINQKSNFIRRVENNVTTCDEELRLPPDDSDRIEAVLCADLLRNSSICSP
jgi:hypothetical protein